MEASEEEKRTKMHIDHTFNLGTEHLKAGHFNEAINLLSPLTMQCPSDTRLYHGILAAATKDFTDLEMADPNMKNIASDAWDRLTRLDSVSQDMISYARKRFLFQHHTQVNNNQTTVFWLFLGALASIIAGILFVTKHYFLTFLFFCGTIGAIILGVLNFWANFDDTKRITNNPFKY